MGEAHGRPHRPVRHPDPERLAAAPAVDFGPEPAGAGEASAWAVLTAARRDPEGHCERFVTLADRVGLDTLAASWRGGGPGGLPSVLFALFALRHWCRADPADALRLWRAGEPVAAVDAAVAGVAPYAAHADIAAAVDAVLAGCCRGDFAVALERAAAMYRVLAAGRRELGATNPDDARGTGTADLARRNDRTAGALAVAAQRWRAGSLP